MKLQISKLWTIRNIILISITSLLILALGATLYVSSTQLAVALGRGVYLDKHFARFVRTQEYLGGFIEVVAGTVAADPTLADCLAPPTPPPPLVEGATSVKAAPSRPRCSIAERWGALAERLEASFDPELVVLTDATDQVVGSSHEGFTSEKLRRNLFYQRASQGLASAAWVELDGQGYLVAGAPILNRANERAGTLLIGLKLSRIFDQHAQQSGTNRAKHQHLFFIASERTLGASFLTKEARPEVLAKAFAPAHRVTVEEGGQDREVLVIEGTQYDFFHKRQAVIIGSEQVDGELVMARQRTHQSAKEEQFLNYLYLTFGISLIVGLIFAFFFARTIVRPLRGFIQYTEEMGHGGADLTYRFPVRGYQELADLGRNLNAVLDHLQFLFNQVKRSSLEVGNSATEISVTASQLHQRSQEQSIKIEDITTAVNEMNQMIQQLAANAAEAAAHASRGSEAVSGASTAIIDIRTVVLDSSDHVKTLGEHSARIGNIVETIRQIADQTGLLALNASIEAAHAGEHGKGFAVVANEVSNLAERSNKSARQIEEQLAQIRLLTEQAVRKMEQGVTTVDAGVVKVDSTFRDLNEMMTVVQEIGEREHEQAQVSDNIARNMEDIFMIVREGLSATEQTVHEGERLKDLARVLLEGVDKFRTDAEPVAAPALPARRFKDREDEEQRR